MTSLAAEIDPGVEKVILRCLNPDPALRPATALSVAAALPGGDPLAAALAAGETPSPELVAASGQTKGFALRYAIPYLVFALVSVLAYPFLMQPISTMALSPMEFPPAVLDAKAREMAAAFGYPDKPKDWASGFETRTDYLDFLEKHTSGRRDWRALFQAESPIGFMYRQSPLHFSSPPDGTVDANRPAPLYPGMLMVFLDSRGNLRRFQAIAPRLDEDAGQAGAPIDAGSLFQRASLDLARFHEVPPSYAPALAFDSRQAWSGVFPGLPDTSITVEIAAWHGKVTSFFIRWPWISIPKSNDSSPVGGLHPLWTAFSVVFIASGMLAVILLARRNLKRGRGDRKGAFRIAMATFLFYAISWLAAQHIVPNADMIDYFFHNLSIGVALGGAVWLLYMALEPAVRARWPHSLITWNRLLAGNFGDPRLGSHILVGVVLGMLLRCLFLFRQYWLIGRGVPPDNGDVFVLSGLGNLIASMTNVAMRSIIAGAVIFFLLTGLRAAVRVDWLAALIAACLMTLQEGGLRHSPNFLLDLSLYIWAYAVLAFALLRQGMVPAIIAILTIDLLGNTPIGADFSCWYNSLTVIPLVTVSAIAIYGFWRSQTLVGVQAATER